MIYLFGHKLHIDTTKKHNYRLQLFIKKSQRTSLMYIRRKFILLPFLVIVGCSPIKVSTAVRSATEASPQVAEKTIQVLSPILNTRVVGTATPPIEATPTSPTKTAIVTSQPTPVIHKSCMSLVSTFPIDQNYTGKIALINAYVHPPAPELYYDEIYFYNLSTKQKPSLFPFRTIDISFSPDYNYFAFMDRKDNLTKIFSSEMILYKTIFLGGAQPLLDQWLGTRYLLFRDAHLKTPHPNAMFIPADIIIHDIQTNDRQTLNSNYPDIDTFYTRMWDGGDTTKYNPDFSRVIYRSYSKTQTDTDGNPIQEYILWDLEKHEIVLEIPSGNFFTPPVWSPDGSKFAVVGPKGDLLVVTKDGVIRSYLDASVDVYSAERFSWSPDGRKIGFWLKKAYVSNSFAILDLSSGDITDTCIPLGVQNDYLDQTFRGVWSPDGQLVAIRANQSDRNKFDALLLDLTGGFAVKIADNIAPIGWLIQKP
jgi:Tol biopolymer transport system component